ncbi:MAG: glycosyltransferase family 2 protein [Actinomycetota bacterium]|nr:glycosyltransferase family 2 protein [Actinomycetota bacterium]
MPADIIVAVPAHDEQHRIAACVASVVRSVETAVQAGMVGRALVTVSAHRCLDATSSVAEVALASGTAAFPEVVQTAVLIDDASHTVGDVRARMIAAALRQLPAGPDCWLFSTDADSVVPPEWIVQTLEHAATVNAVAVAGMVDVVGWRSTSAARRRYRHIIHEGLTPTGHRHVYGANLAVRSDAYLAVGGFKSVAHGEDTCLVESLRAANFQVASTFSPVVTTSGRVPGRAQDGLGSLLGRLVADDPQIAGPTEQPVSGPPAGLGQQLPRDARRRHRSPGSTGSPAGRG